MASVVPSILAGDFARLGKSLEEVHALGVPAIHIDVMDGHFRPQVSVGQPVVRRLRRATHLKLDVHLMIERPGRYIEDFVSAGADSLAFHPEATQDISHGIDLARRMGVKVGLALNPAAPAETCYEVLENLDYVLIQTADAGRGGARFIRRSLSKVSAVAKERESRGLTFAIAAEGAIETPEAEELVRAGADILVVGSAIFDKQDRGKAMRALVRTLSHDSSAQAHQPEIKFWVH